jgi:general secretion pathway protein H
MDKPAVKVRMPMSEAGSEIAARRSRGFTLIELMVVITMIAIATAGVSFAIRDNAATVLEREADRLSTILETVRVQSRGTGVAMAWLPVADGFAVLPAAALADGAGVKLSGSAMSPWLAPGMSAQIVNSGSGVAASLLLGAEPMIAPSTVVLRLGERSLAVTTDGLRPFTVGVAQEAAR